MFFVLIYNIAVLAAFTTLAVVFNKWWIIFFALLFVLSTSKTVIKKPCRVCDGCGRHSQTADDYEAAIKAAEKAGWLHVEDRNLDYCPACRKKLSIEAQ